jgi:MOSC domain-containing protein YiiM
MRILSVNVSPVREVTKGQKTLRTAHFKEPVEGPVHAGPLGLEGDQQADKRHHGGPHQAVYAYSFENHLHWRRELKRPELRAGSFAENLTVEGMPDTDVHIGDVFRIGSAVMQVTLPRGPCSTLAFAMGDTSFPKAMLAALRLGFYLRVLEEGVVKAGDEITLVSADPAGLSIAEVARLRYFDSDNTEAVRRAAAVEAMAPKLRDFFAQRAAAKP